MGKTWNQGQEGSVSGVQLRVVPTVEQGHCYYKARQCIIAALRIYGILIGRTPFLIWNSNLIVRCP